MGTSSITHLGVIIVSWNVKELLDACLLSLREDISKTSQVAATVWVIDNASHDGTADMVCSRHPWVNLETSLENLGFVRGNNWIIERLLQTSAPDYLWLLNPDTVIQPGALAILLDFMNAHPRAGLSGPQLLNPDGSHQPGAFRFPDVWQPLFDFGWLPQRFYYTRWNGRYPAQAYARQQPFRIDHPLGAAMLARTAAVQQVGLLDEGFFMYCEEIDWAWRMRKAGWEAWLVPEAQVIHVGGASTGQARAETTAYLWESRARLYRKHRGRLTRALAGFVVQRAFSAMMEKAESPAWEQAYSRIMRAWQNEKE